MPTPTWYWLLICGWRARFRSPGTRARDPVGLHAYRGELVGALDAVERALDAQQRLRRSRLLRSARSIRSCRIGSV